MTKISGGRPVFRCGAAVKGGQKLGPDVVEQSGLRIGARVHSIRLHQFGFAGDSFEKKRHIGDRVLRRYAVVDRVESCGVCRAVVRGHAHANQQGLGAALPYHTQHGREIFPQVFEGQAPQAVVAAGFNDDEGGAIAFEKARQASRCGKACFAADAGVDDLIAQLVLPQAIFQQTDPTLFRRHAVGCAETVAEHKDDRLLLCSGTRRDNKRCEGDQDKRETCDDHK